MVVYYMIERNDHACGPLWLDCRGQWVLDALYALHFETREEAEQVRVLQSGDIEMAVTEHETGKISPYRQISRTIKAP